MRNILIAAYLDYINDYLTIDAYAKDNGLSREQAETLITLARDVANSQHPEA